MSDLEKFLKIFGCTPKIITDERYMFKVKDLDTSIAEARQIIAKNELKVAVVNTADMASYSAFEVISNS